MLFLIQYVLFFAICTQQSFGSFNGDGSRPSEKMLKSRKGYTLMVKDAEVKDPSKIPLETSKPFSFKEFYEYAKLNHADGAKISKMLNVWIILAHRSATQITDDDKSIIEEWMNGNVKYSKSDMEYQTSEKKNILEKALKNLDLDDDGKKIVISWWYNNFYKIRGAEQAIFLNGKPDEGTVELFKSLKLRHYNAANKFLSEHDLHVDKICGDIAEKFFKPDVNIIPDFFKGGLPAKYRCEAGNYNKDKVLNSIGWCRDAENKDISYIRIAVAKVKKTKGSFIVRYFIAFDNFNTKVADSTMQYIPQVAASFFATYDKQKDNPFKFKLDISSLNEN